MASHNPRFNTGGLSSVLSRYFGENNYNYMVCWRRLIVRIMQSITEEIEWEHQDYNLYKGIINSRHRCTTKECFFHDDVIKWKHFPRNWPFVREIHRSPVNFPRNGQWRGALMFSLINAWINDWLNNREAGDLRRQHGHYDVIVMRHFCISNNRFLALCFAKPP